ncbi:MAG: Quercetin 2,3-dioxygenase [Phycisphaerae bacterium]|nr:Quercetin 2,3-dioxygenase [Phycisphaerae bacterium]
MITIRNRNERGHFNHGWLDTYHTFSFGDYRDPRHMGFRVLRVINEDRVAPGTGFDLHPHRDMEIITYVLSGRLEHRDSLGNGAVIQPGTVQYMAAGSGIVHGEFNPSPDQPVHLMQIWILPDRRGLPPRYEQRDFPAARDAGRLTLLASADGRDGSIRINQDVALLAARLRDGQQVSYPLGAARHAWVQLLRGSVTLASTAPASALAPAGDLAPAGAPAPGGTRAPGGLTLRAGDAAALSDEPAIDLKADADAELLLFDLP